MQTRIESVFTESESSDDPVGEHEDRDVGREGGEDEPDAGEDCSGDARDPNAVLVHETAHDRPGCHVDASLMTNTSQY